MAGPFAGSSKCRATDNKWTLVGVHREQTLVRRIDDLMAI